MYCTSCSIVISLEGAWLSTLFCSCCVRLVTAHIECIQPCLCQQTFFNYFFSPSVAGFLKLRTHQPHAEAQQVPGWQLVWTFTCWGTTRVFTSKSDTWGRNISSAQVFVCRRAALITWQSPQQSVTPVHDATSLLLLLIILLLFPSRPPSASTSTSSHTRWMFYGTYIEAVQMMHRLQTWCDHKHTTCKHLSKENIRQTVR